MKLQLGGEKTHYRMGRWPALHGRSEELFLSTAGFFNRMQKSAFP
jgi:hypothetical protein